MTTRTRSRTSTRTRSIGQAIAEGTVTTETPIEKPTTAQLVLHFLEGSESQNDNFTSIGGALYQGKRIVARRAKDGTVILPTASADNVELNDQLMGQIFAAQRSFRRLDGFDSLTDPSSRSRELKTGNYDDFRAVANLFEFEVNDEDIAAIERAKAFNTRVTEFFTKLQADERDRIRTAEEKERAERVKQQAITWDSGEGRATNHSVTGAGGGQRLRLRSGTRGTIETSHGQTMNVRSAKRAFDHASRFWHGGEIRTYRNSTLRSSSSYNAVASMTELSYGCQSVTREEAERFADVMGWERAKPSA
jgi:hypothetical protein